MTEPFFVKSVKETDVKAKANDYALLRGWWQIKVETPTMNGVPDHIYYRRGVYIWMEWKRPAQNGKAGGRLSAVQVSRIKDMRERGMTVYVFDNLEDAKRILK